MSISQIKNSNVVLVGIGTATTPPAASISDLAEGQIGVFTVDGVFGAVGADANFVFAMGGSTTKPAFVSETINPADITVTKARGLEVATQQLDSIGYNGTSGSIATLTADNLYMVDVMVQELLTSNTDGRYIKHFQYKSGSSAPTQADVAVGLAASGIFNFKREAEKYIRFKALCSQAAAATHAFDNVLTITKGSKVVSVATNLQYNGGTELAVGDYIRIPETDVTTAVGDDVYKVISISSLNVTLDREVQITSGTRATTDENQVITAAQSLTADWGVTLTGLALSFVVGKEQFKQARWELILKDFGTTVSARSTNAYKGIGTYEEAQEAEWFAMGQLGEYSRMGEPTIHPANLNAASGVTYDVTTILYKDNSVVGLSPTVSEKSITIYSPNGADYMTETAANNGVWTQLEAILANTTGKMSHRDTGASSDTAGSLTL
jgi:hypothetical protein